MVCCEIDAERAYCELSESCSKTQIMGGIAEASGQMFDNCCYLTDKIEGRITGSRFCYSKIK